MAMRTKIKVWLLQQAAKSIENRWKFRFFLGCRFWLDFEGVWGRFWEVKIRYFLIFFDVFSKQISNNILEDQKIEKKRPKKPSGTHFGSKARNDRPPGERKREGSRSLRTKSSRKELEDSIISKNLKYVSSTPCTTYGGRRIRFGRYAPHPKSGDHSENHTVACYAWAGLRMPAMPDQA